MCTAVTYKTKDFYFGRTLDYEFSYGDEVVIMPRNYPSTYRHMWKSHRNYAIIGMAHVVDGYPLYYDAINEKGLAMAGLNFSGNAKYNLKPFDARDICQFELIPWVLRDCKNVNEAMDFIRHVNILEEPFNDKLPVAELHWIIADQEKAITVEFTKRGLFIYDNPIGVLTNNPPFNYQMVNLNNYMGLSAKDPVDTFGKGIDLCKYSRGMGAMGLPGDLSSMSRFVRVAFTKLNSISNDDEMSSVSQFFHILNSVEQQRGCCELEDKKYEITIYTSCCNVTKGIYYYTTYDNHQINAIDMHKEDLDSDKLIKYQLITEEHINYQN